MHKITKPAPGTMILIIIPTPRLPKIRNGAKFNLHFLSIVIPPIHNIQRITRLLLILKFGIHMPHHMITKVITNMQTLQVPKFRQFEIKILKKNQKVFHCFFGINLDHVTSTAGHTTRIVLGGG